MSEVFFQRLAQREILAWRKKDGARPLVLRGGFNIGKTTLVEDLIRKSESADATLSFDLSREHRVSAVLAAQGDPQGILTELIGKRTKFIPERGMLVFEHVPAATAREIIEGSLLLFQRFRTLHILICGELDDRLFDERLRIEKFSFIDLGPLTFGEFLAASGIETLARPILATPETANEATHKAIIDQLGIYLRVGGLPEVLRAYVSGRSMSAAADAQSAFEKEVFKRLGSDGMGECAIDLYKDLLLYHGEKLELASLSIQYALSLRKRAIDMLFERNCFHKVCETVPAKGRLELNVQQRGFRAVVVDAGLLRHSKESHKTGGDEDEVSDPLAERQSLDQFLGQELAFTQRRRLFTWTSLVRGSFARVDYVAEIDSKPVPIILAGPDESKQLTSMNICLDTYLDCPAGIIFGMDREVKWITPRIIRLPLYFALSATTRPGFAALLKEQPEGGSVKKG